MGVTSASISYYESGKRQPDFAFMNMLASIYNVNTNWLLTGEGSMFVEPAVVKPGPFTKTFHLPVIGDIAAGYPIEFYEDEPRQYIDIPVSLLTLPPPYDVFTVAGESMAPLIYPGDYVILSRDWSDIELNGRICAFRVADGITLKRLVEDEAHKTVWLWPINHGYTPTPFNDETEDYQMVGVLVLSIRKYG